MRVTKEEIYDIWRPEKSVWTAWAKPVLFSFLSDAELSASINPLDVHRWIPAFEPWTAIVADLPGVEGVRVGLELARVGYRPVPIYNACPFPPYPLDAGVLTILSADPLPVGTAVDMQSIMRAISASTETLRNCNLADDAPPVFLLDKNRKGRGRPDYGWFDNRSFVTVADFPSADFLTQHEVSNVVVLQNECKVDADLFGVLLEWQEGGIQLKCQEAWQPWQPRPKAIKPQSLLARIWYRLALTFRYPSHENGAFGEWVRPSTG